LAGPRLLPVLVLSTVLPYLAATLGATHFSWVSLLKVIALPLVLGLWYRVLPAAPLVDVAFLAVVVAVKLGKFANPVYLTNYKGLEIARLGDLALFHIAVLVLMLQRHIPETGYGFIPTRKDWRIGIMNYLCFIPIGVGLTLWMKAAHLVALQNPWKLAGYFVAWLFTIALAEEFVFRGVLQQWMEDWTRNRQVALVLTSLLFGSVHLWFRSFPNWKWLIIAGVMGWFCGRARNQAESIRAAMVTHTLVITTWRGFFA